MLQRLFLAFTLAFPLYLSIAIQQTSPIADRVNRPSSRGINKIEQTVKTIQKQLKPTFRTLSCHREKLRREKIKVSIKIN
ncbi:hypothetical protein, partial [Microcystis aeruginosa]|uniref:hypothetical protein n=1 Tax=Microcystis aeruginosa TaxID=1126 RepID=UPI000DA1C88A